MKTHDIGWMLLPISFIAIGMARHSGYGFAYKKLRADHGEDSIVAHVTSYVFYADMLEQIGRKEVGELPGPIYHEVYEEFGHWWANQIVNFDQGDQLWPNDDACMTELRVLMLKFFNPKDDPRLTLKLQNQFWSIQFRKEEYK